MRVALNLIEDISYSSTIFVGFSASCNTILRGILEQNVHADKLILFSPWMPVVKANSGDIIQRLTMKSIDVVIVCGTLDEKCMPLCNIFEKKQWKYECRKLPCGITNSIIIKLF